MSGKRPLKTAIVTWTLRSFVVAATVGLISIMRDGVDIDDVGLATGLAAIATVCVGCIEWLWGGVLANRIMRFVQSGKTPMTKKRVNIIIATAALGMTVVVMSVSEAWRIPVLVTLFVPFWIFGLRIGQAWRKQEMGNG